MIHQVLTLELRCHLNLLKKCISTLAMLFRFGKDFLYTLSILVMNLKYFYLEESLVGCPINLYLSWLTVASSFYHRDIHVWKVYVCKNLTKCIQNVRLKNELMPRPIFATNEFLDQVKLMNLIQVINDSQWLLASDSTNSTLQKIRILNWNPKGHTLE